MQAFWLDVWKFAFLGLVMSVAGFIMFFTERKRPKAEQRTWFLAVALTFMALGAILGLGIGDGFFTVSVLNMFKN